MSRTARSLVQLQAELDKAFPGRVKPDWTLGDQAHAARASDHNPNAADVVCAIDVRGASTARALWDHIRATRPARVKYMIFNRQIISSTVSPWTVRSYGGSNPHSDHIHISVGRGPDGQSGRPDLYDSSASWGLSASSPPPSSPPPSTGDWFEMADKKDLEEAVKANAYQGPTLVAYHDWEGGEPVFLTDFQTKTKVKHGSPLHKALQFFRAVRGESTNATRVDRAVLDAIPTVEA